MRIDITRLKEDESLALEHDYDPKALNLELYDLHYLALLKFKGTLDKIKTALFLKGTLATKLEILCTRCLKPVPQNVTEKVDLYYPFTNQEFLETTDDVRETMLLSYPVKFLCHENCKGLCYRCGANLNEESCQCAKQDDGGAGGGGAFDRLKEWYSKRKKTKES